MRVLIWNNIWISQGNANFSLNCLKNILLKEAIALSSSGADVDLVIPEHFKNKMQGIDNKINIISVKLEEAYKIKKDVNPILEFYAKYSVDSLDLSPLTCKLKQNYDVVLLWETPVPFLEKLYPNAVFLHQMPGVFSRPPAHNFVTIDTAGLYKRSLLFNDSERIKNYRENDWAEEYVGLRKNFFESFNFYENEVKKYINEDRETVLLPLQVSDHYNFRNDTRYSSQLDFLLDVVLHNKHKNIIATQYVTPNISDTVLTEDNLDYIKTIHDRFIFNPLFNEVTSVSELILPYVDKIASSSSSLAIQGLILNKKVEIYGDTYLKPYDNRLSKINANSISSFLLSKYNLNFDFAISEKDFFINFIESLISRKGKKGIETLINFEEISNNYIRSLEFNREGRARKNWKCWLKNDKLAVNNISKAINDPAIKIISFDIFDTLISRSYFRPTDIFFPLSDYVTQLTNGRIRNFFQLRIEAEQKIKEIKEETTLDEIYEYIKSILDITESVTNKIKEKEIALEYSSCSVCRDGRKLFLEAKRLQKRIIMTSDMYLPKNVIENLLMQNGYSYDKLYLSSEIGYTKAKDGNLFKFIKEKENIDGSCILHIGDKKVNDVDNAVKQGLQARRLISTIDRIKGNKKLIEAFDPKKNLFRSVCLGLYKERILNQEEKFIDVNSLTYGSLYNFGYAAIGPFVLGYTLWLKEQCEEKKFDKLFFLAREGNLLWKAFQILSDAQVNSSYILASRKSLYGATLQSTEDIFNYCNVSFASNSNLFDILKNRFDLDEISLSSQIINKKVDNTAEGRKSIFEAALKFKDIILTNSEKQRILYINYLKSEGFYDSLNPAIIDIGWQGRMQSRLEILTERKVTGLYYATLPQVLDNIVAYSYAGNKIEKDSNSIAANYRKYIEYFVCAPTKSFKCFEKINGKPEAIFLDEEGYYRRARTIEEIHEGALKFIKDYKGFIDKVGIKIHPSFNDCESVLKYFLKNKLFDEIKSLESLSFNDEIAGSLNIKLLQKDTPIEQKDSMPKLKNNLKNERQDNVKLVQPKIDRDVNSRSLSLKVKRSIEKWIIDHIVSEKLKNKYYNDREAYLRDSKSTIFRILAK